MPAGRRDHITPVLRRLRLHWLPVRQRVVFKVAGLVHQSLDGVAPTYLIDNCRLLSDAVASRRPLRSSSSDIRTLVFPRTHNKFGDRSFSVAGPRVWNDLPSGLRQPGLSFATFRRQLKTFFCSATQCIETLTVRIMCDINTLYVCMYVCMYVATMKRCLGN